MLGCRSHVWVQVTCWYVGQMLGCRSHVWVQVTWWGAGHIVGFRQCYSYGICDREILAILKNTLLQKKGILYDAITEIVSIYLNVT